MTYQSDPDSPPDSCFEPGNLRHLVPGNEGRCLDPRRTPIRVREIVPATGIFVVEILDFEDKGAHWELPFEAVSRFQFARGSVTASEGEVGHYEQAVQKFDRPLRIPSKDSARVESEARIAVLRQDAGRWLKTEPAAIRSSTSLDDLWRTGNSVLWNALTSYFTAIGLADIEDAFATQYVRNPESGELIKGHRIVLAELGLVSYLGKQVRDPVLFDGQWNKDRRSDHILYRLAFVRELFSRLGHSSVVLYRGFSCDGQPAVGHSATFVSATFNLDVASSHFEGRDRARTGVLIRQTVPIERLFMTCVETGQMNRQYREAEAVLLCDPANSLF
jgi:hypothetical protein